MRRKLIVFALNFTDVEIVVGFLARKQNIVCYPVLLKLIKKHGKSDYVLIVLLLPGQGPLLDQGIQVKCFCFVDFFQAKRKVVFYSDVEDIPCFSLGVFIYEIYRFYVVLD